MVAWQWDGQWMVVRSMDGGELIAKAAVAVAYAAKVTPTIDMAVQKVTPAIDVADSGSGGACRAGH